MPRPGGPASRNAINPAALVAFIDAWTEHVFDGYPKRTRLKINGTPITETDARMVRRWRKGDIKGVTIFSAEALLERHGLALPQFAVYCEQLDPPLQSTLRGKLPKENA
jgi:hypothetical protein